MARIARKHSDTGVYHAILRGVNKQQIFECTEDYQRFLNILRAQTLQEQDEAGHRSKPHCVIYDAYCQMGNHVHLLVKESGEPLSETIKRISSSYVYYYNHKYGRIGHLFQERFKSQPVCDWTYFPPCFVTSIKIHLSHILYPPSEKTDEAVGLNISDTRQMDSVPLKWF